MSTLADPVFFDRDVNTITAEYIDMYEKLTGKVLQPAQPERLFIDLIVYRETLLRIQANEAAKQNLVRYAQKDMLDYIGELDRCTRLPEQPALTTLRVTLIAAQTFDVVVPAGTRRGSKDGKYVFTTDVALTIPTGQLTGDVAATADVAGITGNGYLAGEINVEIDPVAYAQSIVNISVTLGGADPEADDHYRDRIILRPESFSTAGPEGAYIFWARSAHQDIVDVAVTSPSDGVINVYPLLSTGLPAAEILTLVSNTLTAKKVRPLTDHVFALAPTEVQFAINVAVTLYDWAGDDAETARQNIVALLEDYTAQLRAGLGYDLVLDQIKGRITGYRGVYKSNLIAPVVDQVLEANQWLNCTGINVTIAGYAHG
ncbi:MAG: baseplate J/gp47 family protein [Geobacteraceae bacterium]|nr:baseplate J/gp47 family protein [Geobacteraceae bacterium]